MIHALDQFTNHNANDFLERIHAQLKILTLDVVDFELDHICYRVDSIKRYFELKAIIHNHGKLLIESRINGRAISIFKLDQAIQFGERMISVFELPSPKAGSEYREGYEHVELVPPFPLEKLLKLYPTLDFDMNGFNKKFNRDIRIKFGSISVKFHEQSLEQIIEIESHS